MRRSGRVPLFLLVLVALVALVAVELVTPGRALSKEHAAGCLTLSTLVERLRNSLILAAVHRARGSSLAAYEVLRTNAEGFLNERTSPECGVLPQILERALTRAAAAETAVDASLELDLGYTAALSVALEGRVATESLALKRLDVPESAQYGEDCPDIFALARRLAAPAPGLLERVASVLADLRAQPRCPQLRELLESTPADHLSAAVLAFVLDEVQGSPSGTNPIARCPELPTVLDRLTAVITVGAPLYNRGDHEGCWRLYDRAARSITERLVAPGHCPAVRTELESALAEAAGAPSPGEAAWALRRAFDRIAGSVSAGR
jgi:hypothetical protein